jgi:threonine dehydrogenase-like Zn-dependent dehydrogenase
MHAVQLAAKVFKAKMIIAIDVLDWKLRLAKDLGAEAIVNAAKYDAPKTVDKITEGEFGNVVVDFVGHRRTMEQAIASTGKGGRVVLVGISRDYLRLRPYETILGKELEIIGVNDHLHSELDELVQFVDAGRISLSRSVTHRVTLNNINSGFEILESRREKAARVVMVADIGN